VSKAFTSEETPDDPVLGRPVQRAARGQERPMTPEGYKALLTERESLLGAKTDELKHRLAVVTATLESVRVVTPPPADGVVRFGSTVHLEWDDGREQEIRIVGVDEAGSERPWTPQAALGVHSERIKTAQNISVESPLARTLLEQREGDEVEVIRPRGVATARLVRVS
jgi:transcription elongation factor GreB